jgi:hypothetical protein
MTVALGERLVAEQRQRVAELEREGQRMISLRLSRVARYRALQAGLPALKR